MLLSGSESNIRVQWEEQIELGIEPGTESGHVGGTPASIRCGVRPVKPLSIVSIWIAHLYMLSRSVNIAADKPDDSRHKYSSRLGL